MSVAKYGCRKLRIRSKPRRLADPRAISLSCPAGYIEGGEEPLAAAKRELREETGYEAEDWAPLGHYVVDGNYGICTEHVFLARDARRVSEPASGDLEEIEVVTVPRAQITQVLRRGEIVQLSSVAAVALATVLLGRDQ